MKKIITTCVLLFFAFRSTAQCPWSFTITNITGSYTLTCTNPTINLSASNNNTNSVNYLWTGPAFSSSLANIIINQPGNYSLVATDAVTSCSLQQTFAIAVNTVAPTNSVNPVSYSLTCASTPTFFAGTVLNLTVNIQHDWYGPFVGWPPIQTTNNTITILPTSGQPPGTYTLITTNLENGCVDQKTVEIVSLISYPSFSISSNTGFSVGCVPTTLTFTNVLPTPTSPAVCSYTMLSPTFTGVITPGVILSNNSFTTTSIPGTWTFVVQDNSNFCRTEIPVVISQNTTAIPAFNYSVGGAGLVFFTSTSTGTSGGTTYSWDFGDGATGTGQSTSHTYSNGGVHNVVLNTNNPNCNTANVPVNVNTLPCTANSGFTLAYSGTPQNWLASPNYYGNITNAVWNWGDGNSDNILFTNHTYSAAGFYNICLSVTVSCAGTSSSCSNYNIFKTTESTVNADIAMVTVSVVPKITVGLKTIEAENNLFSLYPNPTNSIIYIQNPAKKNGSIKVFNFEGKGIENLILEKSKETKIENLNPGIYFVEINVDGSSFRKKIVVLR